VDGIALAAAQRWFSDDFRRRNPQVVESWRRTVASTAVPAYTGIARSIQSMDLRPMISTITCPTRIVCGDEDENTGPSVAASIARHIAGSQVHVVTGAGHFPNLERPIEFNAQLLQWLSPGCEDADRRH
jgi:3-oxoadipate enol-lactonase